MAHANQSGYPHKGLKGHERSEWCRQALEPRKARCCAQRSMCPKKKKNGLEYVWTLASVEKQLLIHAHLILFDDLTLIVFILYDESFSRG